MNEHPARSAPAARCQGYQWRRAAFGLSIIALFAVVLLVLWQSGFLNQLNSSDTLQQTIAGLGLIGPVLVVVLMTIAIVMSPIPSAPIALAAGAAYGHFWGTLYVVIGSVAGASIAFSVTRLVGQDALSSRMRNQVNANGLQRFILSQNALMLTVFATRLLPFLSFDIVSYAAGLTPLRAWRFAIATILGVLPASFLLAHFGGELGGADLKRAVLAVLALGSITLLPFAWKLIPIHWRSSIGKLFRWH